MGEIRLAIFDLDGVITSTTREHFLGWRRLFEIHYGVMLPEDVESLVKGVSRADSYLRILAKMNLAAPSEKVLQQHLAQKNAIYLDLIDRFDRSRILPGAKELLETLRADGIRTALGSASRNAPNLLSKIGLSDQFDYVVDPTGLPGKPEPDIFLEAMRHFDLRPSQCIGFEDAPSGIQAIKSGGMIAVGVGPETLDMADYRFQSLTEIAGPMYRRLFEENHGHPRQIDR